MIPKCLAPNPPVQLQTVGLSVMGLGWGHCCDEFAWALLSGMAVVPRGTRWPFVQSQLLRLIQRAKASQCQVGIKVAL